MKKILVLGGGFSKERAISLVTAKSVLKALKKKRYRNFKGKKRKNTTDKSENWR